MHDGSFVLTFQNLRLGSIDFQTPPPPQFKIVVWEALKNDVLCLQIAFIDHACDRIIGRPRPDKCVHLQYVIESRTHGPHICHISQFS